MIVLSLSFPDGTVGRMQYVGEDQSDERLAAEIAKSVFPGDMQPVSWRRCSLSDFPSEHAEFREAWTDDGSTIFVEMGKAKELTRDRLRKERAPILSALDTEAVKALEAKDEARLAEVSAEKQRLRDITALPEIDAAKTPGDLKAIKAQVVAGVAEAKG